MDPSLAQVYNLLMGRSAESQEAPVPPVGGDPGPRQARPGGNGGPPRAVLLPLTDAMVLVDTEIEALFTTEALVGAPAWMLTSVLCTGYLMRVLTNTLLEGLEEWE